jgi:hypothetical protein
MTSKAKTPKKASHSEEKSPKQNRRKTQQKQVMSTPTKRIIVSVSNKGGVGKSFFLIQLIEWLKEHPSKPTFAAFDPDEANKTLLTFHKDCTEFIDTDQGNALDRVVMVLNDVDVSILDGLGSQQKKTIIAWLKDVDIFQAAEELGFRVTFVVMVEEDRDVILQTKSLLDDIGDKVDWVFALNRKNAKNSLLWENSSARKIGLGLGGIEINVERLMESSAIYLTKETLSVRKAVDQAPNLLDRNRFRGLWRRMSEEFAKAEAYFLPAAK